MTRDQTLEFLIERLARKTGAPSNFVKKLRYLFMRRGIAMAANSAPYHDDVVAAFEQLETIRMSVATIQQNLSLARQQIYRLERMGVQTVMNLGEVRDGMKRHTATIQTATRQMSQLALTEIAKKLGVRLHIDR